MKLKKVIAILMSVVTAISMLAGCFGEKKTTGANNETYQIDWFFLGDQQLDVEKTEQAIADYLKDKINVTVKLNALDWGNVGTKVTTMLAGNEKFDLLFVNSNNYLDLVSKNGLLPLNELLDEYGQGIKDAIGENFLEGSKVDGVNYAIPVNKEQGHHYGILYQKELAEKHGLTEQLNNVKTFEDMIPILEYIRDNEPDYIPYRQGGGINEFSIYDFEQIVFPAAFYPDSTDGKIVNYVETPEFMEAAKKIHSYYKSGFLPKGGDINLADAKFFSMPYTLKPGKDVEFSSATTEWKQIDITVPRMQARDTMGSMVAISKTSKNPEKVMQFLNLLYTDPELLNLVVYGIEDKDYKKLDDGRIEIIENSGYTYGPWKWVFANTFLHYVTSNEDPEKNEKILEYNKILKPSNYLGFNPDTSSVKSQVGACNSVMNEFMSQITNGTEDPEVIVNKFIEKLKIAGSDDIIKEMQKQYDEWAKK